MRKTPKITPKNLRIIQQMKRNLPQLTMTGISRKLLTISDLPTLPTIVERIISLTSSNTSRIRDLADVVSNDPSLSSRVIRISNSAFYAPLTPITTIENAIMMLGFEEIRNLCVTTQLVATYHSFGDELTISMTDFWKHALYTAMLSRTIGEQINAEKKSRVVDPDELFLAGLLHDFGKIVIYHCFPKHFLVITALAIKSGLTFYESENILLEVDHAYCGGIVASRWELPIHVTEVITRHHNLPPITEIESEYMTEVAVVHFADYLSHQLQNTLYTRDLSELVWDYLPENLQEGVMDCWGTSEKCQQFVDTFFNSL